MCGVKIFVIMTLVVSLTLATRMDPDRDVRKESERRRKDGETRTNVESKHRFGKFDLEKHPFFHANKDEVRSNDIKVIHLRENEHVVNYSHSYPPRHPPARPRYQRRSFRCPTNKRAYADCYLGFRYGCSKSGSCWQTRFSGENLRKESGKGSWDYWATNTTKEYIKCRSNGDCLRYWKEYEEVAKYECEWFPTYHESNKKRWGRRWRDILGGYCWYRPHPCFNDWTKSPCFMGHRYGCKGKYLRGESGYVVWKKVCWVQDFHAYYGRTFYKRPNWPNWSHVPCNTHSDCGQDLRWNKKPSSVIEHFL